MVFKAVAFADGIGELEGEAGGDFVVFEDAAKCLKEISAGKNSNAMRERSSSYSDLSRPPR